MTDRLGALLDAVARDPGTERLALRAGDVLFRQGEPADAVFLVVTGRLEARVRRADGGEAVVAEVGPGEPVGELGLLAGQARSATVVALEAAELLKLSRARFEELVSRQPELAAPLAELVRQRLRRSRLAAVLPGLFGPLDAAALHEVEAHLEWVSLPGGATLFREGDPGDSLCLLVSGRLRVVASSLPPVEPALSLPKGSQPAGGELRVLNEVAPGECVGEMALLTGEPRSASVVAIRDSELVRLTRPALEHLAGQHPPMMMAIARVVTQRLRRREAARPAVRPAATVAVVPLSPTVPASDFTARLAAALAAFGPTLHLHRERFDGLLGVPGAAELPLDAPSSPRLAAWLDEQEARHRFVVFQADPAPSPWTQRCLRQADRVLLLADARSDPAPTPVEAALTRPPPVGSQPAGGARRTLVLLHSDASRLPSGTARWLDARRVDDHLHVRLDTDADIHRLARCLAGCSVGLALGGGGARGLCHIGVVRALREAGVPLDVIAGSSMGAIIAGTFAMGMAHEQILEVGRDIFLRGRPHKEYTLPLISLIRSRRLDRVLQRLYGDACIEDLWVPFFCVSTNLTTTELMVHRRGPVWKAVRASASLPGVFVPALHGRDVLVDGGVLNNLPGDLLRQVSCGPVIVVEASPEKELVVDFAEFPSPWQLLWDRVRGRRRRAVPSIFDILVRTIVVGSDHVVREVKRMADLVLRPPVQDFGLLEFAALDRIAETGYQYTQQRIAELRAEGALERFTKCGREACRVRNAE